MTENDTAYDEAVGNDGGGDIAAALDQIQVTAYDSVVKDWGIWHGHLGCKRIDDSHDIHDKVLRKRQYWAYV